MAGTSDGLLREAATKVPEVTLVFWIIKIAATTLGETGGDSVTMTLHWGYFTGTLIFLPALVLLVVAQIVARRFHPFLPLLGHDRRIDHVRHHNGRLRRSLSGYRLQRRLCAAARIAAGDAGALVLVARFDFGRDCSDAES